MWSGAVSGLVSSSRGDMSKSGPRAYAFRRPVLQQIMSLSSTLTQEMMRNAKCSSPFISATRVNN